MHASTLSGRLPLAPRRARVSSGSHRRRRQPYQERDFLSRDPPAHGRRPARGRRLLVARRQAARLPERTRAGQSLLPDLRARPDERRRQAHLARAWARRRARSSGPAATRSCSRRRITIRSRSSCRTKSSRSARRARSAATPGTTTRRWTSTSPARRAARLKRLTTARGYDAEGQLLARRPVDRVLVDARRLRPHAHRRGEEAARRRIRATSPRSTSCAPTARIRSG